MPESHCCPLCGSKIKPVNNMVFNSNSGHVSFGETTAKLSPDQAVIFNELLTKRPARINSDKLVDVLMSRKILPEPPMTGIIAAQIYRINQKLKGAPFKIGNDFGFGYYFKEIEK